MSRAQLVVDAIDTLIHLFYAGAAWLLLTAVFATLALYAAAVIVWEICRTVWKATRRRPGGPSWARGRVRARIFARTRPRRSSGRTRPHEFEEAA